MTERPSTAQYLIKIGVQTAFSYARPSNMLIRVLSQSLGFVHSCSYQQWKERKERGWGTRSLSHVHLVER